MKKIFPKIILNYKIFSSNSKHISNKFQRLPFKTLDQSDLNFFNNILPKHSVLTDDLSFYNTDWSRKFTGHSKLVLKPTTTQQISEILKYCNNNKIAVVPQSGNTGLVGGSVPVFDEIIISLSKMNKILNFNPLTSTLYTESGCILENLNHFLNDKGYTMPLDLGSKGSCLIGGNLATNAGGIHFVQHGSLRNSCKGLKAVLANGDILDFLNDLPKNLTGYDLKQLFIGSEGTLGIITECKINIPRKAKYNDLALISLNTFEDIVKIYKILKTELNHYISAIEFFDKKGQEIQSKHGRINPINQNLFYPFYLLIEFESNDLNNKIILQDFLEKINSENLISDAVIAQDENQKKKIWELRETMREGASRDGLVISYDISLPIERFYEIIELVREKIGDLADVVGYGHIGDYNLHINVCYKKHIKDEGYEKIIDTLEPFIYDYLANVNGSVSAEHGIGILKTQYLNRTQCEGNIKLMKKIKNVVDPNGIMNPYKLLV